MEVGVHLPQVAFAGTPLDGAHVASVVDAARDLGFAALSANDHLTFARPWTDGPTLLAAAAPRAGSLELATTAALPVLRGPRAYAAAMQALDQLAEGRVVAGVAAGSSPTDYELAGVPWQERWRRFDEALGSLHLHLGPDVPLWVASWGSVAGLRRVAEYGDGWLASAHRMTPAEFGAARRRLAAACRERGRPEPPHALVTMWTFVTEHPVVAERILVDVLARGLGRDPATLRGRVCIGSAEACAELLSQYAREGCRRVHVWPVADEVHQLERIANEVLPLVRPVPAGS